MAGLYIGLMSGTSLDGVDGVLADFSTTPLRVRAHASMAFDADFRAQLLALNTSGADEIHRCAAAAHALVQAYAAVVGQLLSSAGVRASDVQAIGAHGQTVRHQPRAFGVTGYTTQINNPALLAELTGIDVVADFRSRDVAAGGQGAPLAPFFHQAQFSRAGTTVGVLNLGGISNLTLLRADGSMTGFDCGPANALMDGWCEQHTGQPYDGGGAWAATGTVQPELLAQLLAHPYFAQTPPKSTGRDLFNRAWLDAALAPHAALAPVDVQATLAELTVRSCAAELLRHGPQATELVVCGGGALNTHLMQRLAALLPGVAVLSSAQRGLPPQQVEGAAFAWLARKAVLREKLALQSTTGAQGARVLGAVYPA
ncbi:MAG: anhydro-N-acetylmuramic acid kinase [Ramlibacter sp.]